jgi:penicillin-binding protein 2
MLNKAIQAQLAPGSTFKIVMSVAGLQEGVAQNMHVFCAGGKEFYGKFRKCDAKHGDVDISKGIYKSCDTFFYTLGDKLGIARIAKYAMELGLGQKTHVDLPEEAPGIMPSEEWKIKNFKQKWYAGETISVAIGQGGVAVTPIQLARTIGGIAMGGALHRPHVTFPDQLPDQYKQAMAQLQDEIDVAIDPRNIQIITDAMAGVTGPGGTAAAAHLEGIDFAGKTGTAQTISNETRERLKLNKNQFKDNGWFVGMTPRRNPEIVVAGVVESGGWGASTAPLVAQVIKAYVEKQRKHPQTQVADSKKPAEMTAIWSTPDADSMGGERLQSARFVLPVSNHRKSKGAAHSPVQEPKTRVSNKARRPYQDLADVWSAPSAEALGHIASPLRGSFLFGSGKE